MHIQDIESISGHTGTISGTPSFPQTKVDIEHPTVDLRCIISHRHSYI
jgi:hypothetical protein